MQNNAETPLARPKRFNVFEGSRRLVRLAAVVVVCIGGWNIVNPSPYVHATILFKKDQSPSVVSSCPSGQNVASEYVPAYKSPVDSAALTACFVDILLGYENKGLREQAAIDPRIKSRFGQEIGNLASQKRNEYRIDAAQTTAVAVGIIFLLAYIIGWVARGFAGIPRGSDFRA